MAKRKIINVASHRNGVSGVPFSVVHFRDEDRSEMYGIVFSDDSDCFVAVFDKKLLAAGVIAFGQNSYRGDDYADFLRDAAKQYTDKLCAAEDSKAIARVMAGGSQIWKAMVA